MIDFVYRFDPASRPSASSPATPGEAKRRLELGNDTFADLLASARSAVPVEPHVIPFDLHDDTIGGAGEAVEQAPFAVVLGCSDARVPTELVFGQAYNELFVVRVAGNVLGSECLGSVDYAIGHLEESLKLLVVLGHTGCGAVSAAVDSFLTPGYYVSLATSQAIRSVVDRILIAVRASAQMLETVYGRDVVSMPGYRDALVEESVVVHAALAAHTLEREFAGRSGCEVAFGVFDLVTRRVALGGADDDARARLHAPPRDRESFVDLMTGVATRASIRTSLVAR